MPAAELGADRELQERLLGVRSGGDDDDEPEAPRAATPSRRRRRCSRCAAPMATARPSLDDLAPRTVRGFNRWNAGGTAAPVADIARGHRRAARRAPTSAHAGTRAPRAGGQVFDFPVAASSGRAAYVAGTFDTKGRELFFLRQCLEKLGLRVVTVDLVDLGQAVDRPACTRARWRATIRRARRPCSAATAAARSRRWRWPSSASCCTRRDLGGLISAGGSGGTTLATPACARCRSACPR